jgi:hypothetical protein
MRVLEGFVTPYTLLTEFLGRSAMNSRAKGPSFVLAARTVFWADFVLTPLGSAEADGIDLETKG